MTFDFVMLIQLSSNEIIENRHIKHNNPIHAFSQSLKLNLAKSYVALPYIRGLGQKLRQILRYLLYLYTEYYDIDTYFQSIRLFSSFINSGMDDS